MNFPKRKVLRLKDYDYSQTGGYFITFCTENRAPVLSRITVGKAAIRLPQVELTEYGRITEKYIQNISVAYPHISVENYVIMPNHVHLLLLVGDGGQGAARPTVSAVVRSIKALVRKETGKVCSKTPFTTTSFVTGRIFCSIGTTSKPTRANGQRTNTIFNTRTAVVLTAGFRLHNKKPLTRR